MTVFNFVNKKFNETSSDNNEVNEKKGSKINNNENENKKFDKNASSTTENLVDNENWGYDLYPERRGTNVKPTFFKKLMGPLIQLMMAALKSSGCEVDLRRHISCEVCDHSVRGGYDAKLNQIIVCQNTSRSESKVRGVLAHELIHMFDYCRNKVDFNNIDHLACTEVRAANLVHCSFMSAFMQGTASPFHIKQAHQDCVKNLAKSSLMVVRNLTEEQAKMAIDKIFPMCYNDLEPIGRRIRRNSLDINRAYMEAPLYGYLHDH
ncbi:hypothetical protein M0802_012236 [Mischocyttarus mexicanus]|nr:hypothetical protein M0802_012236 [Mischocyttarus mexicanus]